MVTPIEVPEFLQTNGSFHQNYATVGRIHVESQVNISSGITARKQNKDASLSVGSTSTLVTAFYPLGDRAKASIEDYQKWMPPFFGQVQAPIVAYTPSGEWVAELTKTRNGLPMIIKVVW